MASLVSSFISWANSKFFPNNRRLISGSDANTLAQKIADTFVTKDAPLPNYSIAIQQTDLDGNNQIIITHNLGTIVPGVTIYDENDQILGLAVCIISPLTTNTLRLTFYENIPATGNGAYRFDFFRIVDDIALPFVPPAGEIYTCDFSIWVDYDLSYLYPENWSDDADPNSDYPDFALINNSNQLEIYQARTVSFFYAIPPYTLQIKRYRMRFNLVSGSLRVMINDKNNYYFTQPGIIQMDFLPPASGATRRICFSNYIDESVVIDDLTIYPLE